MQDYKKRVQKAFDIYMERSIEKPKKRSKKNDDPEKRFVKQLLEYLRNQGFSAEVVESKAVYNPRIGRYLSSQTTPGHSDISGTDPDGIAVFIECKALGKRATIRINQYEFLIDKIEKNAFAICTDSIEHFKCLYQMFKHTHDRTLRQRALKADLKDPRKKHLKKKAFTL